MPDGTVRDSEGGDKWTVGTASGRNASVIFDEHGDAVAAVYGLPVNWSVSECKTDAESAEALRRAYLFAAAPAMAEALRAILFQVVQGPVLERDACVTQARAALALAEGGGG